MDSAASMYSSPRMAKIFARIVRAKLGIPAIPTARTVLKNPAPRTEDTQMAMSTWGMEWNMSRKRMIKLSTFPPKNPAMEPRIRPPVPEMATETIPTEREKRPPYKILESMSLPMESVPSQ